MGIDFYLAPQLVTCYPAPPWAWWEALPVEDISVKNFQLNQAATLSHNNGQKKRRKKHSESQKVAMACLKEAMWITISKTNCECHQMSLSYLYLYIVVFEISSSKSSQAVTKNTHTICIQSKTQAMHEGTGDMRVSKVHYGSLLLGNQRLCWKQNPSNH